ncbi:MAG: hypothetical protein AAF497_21355, partial [Planctomycetota bacterium]
MRIRLCWSICAVFLTVSSSFTLAQTYTRVLDQSQIRGDGGSRAAYGVVVEGTTSYNFLSLTDDAFPYDSGRITVTSNIGGATSTTELLSTETWLSISDNDNMAGFYGYGLSGDFLQFTDTGSDAVWRVDKNNGEITEYVSSSTIDAFIGGSGPRLLSPNTVAPNGEHTFYEGDTDSLLITTGANSVASVLSSAELTDITGNASVNGGITYDGAGNLIWGSNTSDAIYSWNGVSGSELLGTTAVEAVTG